MSTPVESMITATTRTQEAATSALRSWADGWQTVAGAQNALGEVPDLVAGYFDATRRILAGQRQLAATLVSAAQTAAERHRPGHPRRRGGPERPARRDQRDGRPRQDRRRPGRGGRRPGPEIATTDPSPSRATTLPAEIGPPVVYIRPPTG